MAFSRLILILLVAYYSMGLMYFIYSYLTIEILTNCILIVFSLILLKEKHGKGWWKCKLKINREQINFIWWTNLRTIVSIPVRYFDMIVISSIISMESVGIYKVYKEIAGLLKRIQDPLNQSIYPEFSKLLANKDIANAAVVAKTSILLLSKISLGITLVILPVSYYVVEIFFGTEYLSNIYALFLLIILYMFSFITVPINSLFIAAGFARYSFLLVLFTNFMYLLTLYGGGIILGIYGIVIAYGVQLFLNKGLKIYFLNKYSYEWGSLIR